MRTKMKAKIIQFQGNAIVARGSNFSQTKDSVNRKFSVEKKREGGGNHVFAMYAQ